MSLKYCITESKKLILIYKLRSSKKKRLPFSFDPVAGIIATFVSINVTEIAASVGEQKLQFKPSAASIN
jgi:hypothetical protein